MSLINACGLILISVWSVSFRFLSVLDPVIPLKTTSLTDATRVFGYIGRIHSLTSPSHQKQRNVSETKFVFKHTLTKLKIKKGSGGCPGTALLHGEPSTCISSHTFILHQRTCQSVFSSPQPRQIISVSWMAWGIAMWTSATAESTLLLFCTRTFNWGSNIQKSSASLDHLDHLKYLISLSAVI